MASHSHTFEDGDRVLIVRHDGTSQGLWGLRGTVVRLSRPVEGRVMVLLDENNTEWGRGPLGFGLSGPDVRRLVHIYPEGDS